MTGPLAWTLTIWQGPTLTRITGGMARAEYDALLDALAWELSEHTGAPDPTRPVDLGQLRHVGDPGQPQHGSARFPPAGLERPGLVDLVPSTDLSRFGPADLRLIEHRINTIPRRSLGWSTTHDVYAAAVAMTG